MQLENVKMYKIHSHHFVYPSYSVCAAYRNAGGYLRGESFLVFVDNESKAELISVKISFENNAGPNCPITIDEQLLLLEAIEQAKGDHRRKAYDMPADKRSYPAWPVNLVLTELPCTDLIGLWLREPSFRDHITAIHGITRHVELKSFLGSLSSLPTIKKRELPL